MRQDTSRRALTLVPLVLALAPLHAQETQAPTQSSPEEVVELSPFIVTSDADRGYVATNSVAGTRLNTTLQEIPASISVVTKDMMNDLGAYNANQLLTYTVGTEVAGAYGNYSGAVGTGADNFKLDDPNRGFIQPTRVRGLSAADNTRDFFLSSIPWDTFNTDRVEINRGPNAMLFGTGSPSGIINMTTIKAEVSRTKHAVTLEAGRFGSHRAQLDTNVVAIKNKLAVRAALKYSDDRFQQEEAYIRDKRAFVAGTYKPFELTTIRADFERGRMRSVRPEWRPPYDLGVTTWFASGKPTWDPTTGTGTLTGPVSTRLNGLQVIGEFGGGGWALDNPALVLDQPDKLGTSIYGLNGIGFATNDKNYASFRGLGRSGQFQRAQHAGEIGGNFWVDQEIGDPRIFDFFNHLLVGQNKPEGGRWNAFSGSIEQLTPDRKGGVEFAYHHEKVNSSYANIFNWGTYGIGIDFNTKLLDGTANPNFGRPVIASDSWSSETAEQRKAARLTAFYTLDMRETGPEWLRKLVGSHTLTGSYNTGWHSEVTNGGRHLLAGPEWTIINPNVFRHNWSTWNDSDMQRGPGPWLVTGGYARGIQTVAYLGNAGNSPTELGIRPITADVMLNGINGGPVVFFNPITNQFEKSTISIVRGSEFDKSPINLSWTGPARKAEIDSKVFIVHSRMLWDTLVPTVGWRKDRLKQFTAAGDLPDPSGYIEVKQPLPADPTFEQEEEAFNWGAVARLPRTWKSKLPWGLDPSVFYNKSDNFAPTGRRVNIWGESIAPTQGTTKEYGFMVVALDGNLGLRFTKYETGIARITRDIRDAVHAISSFGMQSAINAAVNGTNVGNEAAANAMLAWWNSDPVAQNMKQTFSVVETKVNGQLTGVAFTKNRDNEMFMTTDSVSKGWELELTVNPTKNWRLALNTTSQEVVNTNTSRDAWEFLQRITPMLNGPAGQLWMDRNTRQTFVSAAQPFIATITNDRYQEGQPQNPELRKRRFNAMTNYSFDTGALKGFGIGGAVRYGSKVLIGTGYKRDTLLGDIPDYGNAYYGPAETRVDAWVSYRRANVFRNIDWTLQLNVRNIGVDEKLIPTQTQPDGSIAQWRIAEPMTWVLSSRFDF